MREPLSAPLATCLMSRAPASLRATLSALPKRPTDDDLLPAREALIDYAAHSQYPAMAAAALIRSLRKASAVDTTVAARLSSSITEHFRRLRRRAERDARGKSDHVPLRTAAAMLGEAPAELLSKLIDPAQRRLYGWPYWSGTAFMLPVLACRAATRAAFLAAIPAAEPLPIAETLPPWCRRAGVGEPGTRTHQTQELQVISR